MGSAQPLIAAPGGPENNLHVLLPVGKRPRTFVEW